MKWYFAVNEHGLKHAWDQIQVAVNSARRNTHLTPICLVDQGDHAPDAVERIAVLARSGVRIIEHRASVFSIVKEKHGLTSDTYSGHWLRCDIPILDRSDEIVLYTDIDVMFRSDPEPFGSGPEFIACAPEHRKDDWSYFNSGVMLMNLPNLRATRDHLVRHIENNISQMAPHDDQGALNSVYRGKWERLDIVYNWKPYWGFNDLAKILHFHGPKPGLVKHYIANPNPTDLIVPELYEIYQRNVEGYSRFMTESDTYQHNPLQASKPASVLS
jgi:hypothetical protein